MTREEQQLPEGEISNKELLVNHGFEVMSKKQELLAKFDKAVPINKELLLSLAGIFFYGSNLFEINENMEIIQKFNDIMESLNIDATQKSLNLAFYCGLLGHSSYRLFKERKYYQALIKVFVLNKLKKQFRS